MLRHKTFAFFKMLNPFYKKNIFVQDEIVKFVIEIYFTLKDFTFGEIYYIHLPSQYSIV